MRVGKIDRTVLAALSQNPQITKAVREAAREVQRRAKQLAPRDTGNLRRGIKVERVYDRESREVEYHVGWDRRTAFYGGLVELGTEDTPARPHLRPAADEVNRR